MEVDRSSGPPSTDRSGNPKLGDIGTALRDRITVHFHSRHLDTVLIGRWQGVAPYGSGNVTSTSMTVGSSLKAVIGGTSVTEAVR